MQTEKNMTLTLRYVFALSLIALLSITAFFTLRFAITEQESSAAIINVAGRQRMLSQRISRFALLYVLNEEERPSLLSTLNNDLELFEASHAALLNGGSVRGLSADEVLVLSGNPSDAVSAMYFSDPMNLDTQVKTFIEETRSLLASPAGELALDNPHLSYILKAAATDLLTGLNAVTGQYQRESESAIANLQFLETVVLGITLLALMAEALFIFRPMVQQIVKRTDDLQASIATVEKQNETLSANARALNLSSEVGRRLSTITSQTQLVSQVVEQVKSIFNYYHVHIYFYNERNDELIMAGGTGEAGKIMMSKGHKLSKGHGLVGRAAESNKPILVPDTAQSSEWLPNPLLPETASEVAVPISAGELVFGVLDVQHNIPNSLQQRDLEALQSIANQVAIAYQNINQLALSQKIANDLSVVAQVSIATATLTDINILLQEVVDRSKNSFNLYHAHIYMLNETGDTLQLSAGAGEVGRKMVAEGRRIALDSEKSLVARAARTHQGVVVNDIAADPDFLPHPLLPNTRAEMAVPMMVGNQLIGVLDVQSEIIGRFTDVDVNIKTTLASQVAIAVQNARNFEQSKKQAEREAAVNVITQRIQSTTSIEKALQVAARELGHVLGMKPTAVTLEAEAFSTGQPHKDSSGQG